MIAVTVEFDVESADLQKFMSVVTDNAKESLQEPGCLQFDVCSSPNVPSRVFLYEIYDDEKAFEKHVETTHFAKFETVSKHMVLAKRVQKFRINLTHHSLQNGKHKD